MRSYLDYYNYKQQTKNSFFNLKQLKKLYLFLLLIKMIWLLLFFIAKYNF